MSWQREHIVVIGGSAGSIKFLCKLLPQLNSTIPYPIVVAIHRSTEKESMLGYVLQSYSNLPVIEPQAEMELAPGTVYLAPADKHLLLTESYTVLPDASPLVHYSRPSIDVLMLSAAETYKEKTQGILVTGANMDGVNGLSFIKRYGGTVLVQDPKEAIIDFMPKSAIEAVDVDQVLNIKDMVEYLNKLGKVSGESN